jgi:hypothetical protein
MVLDLKYEGGLVKICGKNRVIESGITDLVVSECYTSINHLICLGQGELKNRTVIPLL